MDLTKAELRLIADALVCAHERWDEAARNLGVIARCPEGSFSTDLSPAEASRKERQLRKRLALLHKTMPKFGIVTDE